ncbi:DUF3800 domain-containing protein [Gilliamella sp. Occ4-3]|uniref:DUF3800 domain-containing protein n=1 Tax=Gilliamella sp. Occ4-3 TaxID=3120254 RepID=UPI00080E5CE9|nr:DUF3800 domain-containing protein [Gilliamella apicola]OCG75895.1 hypothetical protein A9G44_07270 [Gilliamella apicola]
MDKTYNIYCDESCHLENDKQIAMVLGSVWCPFSKREEISKRIREIKQKNNMSSNFEIKWTKVSEGNLRLYMDIIDYFFDDDDLCFRGLVIPDKNILDHKRFNQTHDEWYYKMYFLLLKMIFESSNKYNVYIDIKDTTGNAKVTKLHEILCNSAYDYSHNIIQKIQRIHSHESEQLQIADLIIGALSYLFRGLRANQAKLKLIERIKQRTQLTLTKNTLPKEKKFNLLIWDKKEGYE